MTNEEIYQRGVLINDETEPAQNTSERVGGVIKGIGQNLADKDTAIAAEAARNGYYQCTVSGTTLAVTAPGFTLPAHGGNIRIKMSAPATGASTLNINGTGAKALLYNGAAVSSANTWEQNEIISVFYDPSGSGQYLASNSQGGGGKAEKILYNRKRSQLSATNVQDALDEIERNVIDGDYIQGDEISLNSILPGYIKPDGKYKSQSGFSTNTYRVDNLEKIMVEVQPFTEPSTPWFYYVFWSDSQAVTPTMARTGYANNSKFVLDVPQGSKYFGIMTVVTVNNVSYGSTSNVSVFKCSSLQSEVEKITNDLYSSATTDFPTVLNYLTIKNGYVHGTTGDFHTYSSNVIQTAFYDVSKAESIRVNCVTPAGAPYCAFYGADGETALNGRLNYQDGSEFIIPNGAVYFAILFRYNDNLNIDTFTIRANINAGLINQVESLNDLSDLYKSLFDWSPFTWLLVGDSLTESNARAATQYYEWIDKKTNINWINKGQSGKGYANGDYFYSVFNSLSESFSFATIFGSGNDIRYESFPTLSSYSTWDAALGDIDDNGTTSICGYINRALDKFYEVAPLKKIGLITPTPWKNGSASGVTLTDEETMRRMRTYSEKLVLIARKRGIPCLDLFNSSGLRPWNEDFRVEYYKENGVQDSGVHPNSKGHKWISNMFLNFILQYLVE